MHTKTIQVTAEIDGETWVATFPPQEPVIDSGSLLGTVYVVNVWRDTDSAQCCVWFVDPGKSIREGEIDRAGRVPANTKRAFAVLTDMIRDAMVSP